MVKFNITENQGSLYKYNVQVMVSPENGKPYVYAGIGKFCRNKEECEEFINSWKI